MNIAFCMGRRGELFFNNRRVARDEYAILDLINTVGEKKLYIKPYSERLFREFGGYILSNDPLSECGEDDFCFVEGEDVARGFSKAKKLIIYNFSVEYPYDIKFDTPPAEHGFTRVDSKKMRGFAHDKIVKDVYIKE